jgi:carbonic anhydrase
MKTVEVVYRYVAGDSRVRPHDPDSARHRLDEGSHAFAALLDDLGGGAGSARRIIEVDPRDLGIGQGESRAPSQRPFAAVLGCSDARVPTELVFNEGPNDLFVVRVAGNTLGADVLASLSYAVDHLGDSLKLIVVLGHSGCGAVTAAVDVFLNPASYLELVAKHAVRNLLDRLQVVVHATAKRLTAAFGPDVTRRAGYREALIETSIVMNAALSAHTIQRHIGAETSSDLRAVYGVYVLATHDVWAPRCASTDVAGLAFPPSDGDGFVELADVVMQSQRIARLLQPPSP